MRTTYIYDKINCMVNRKYKSAINELIYVCTRTYKYVCRYLLIKSFSFTSISYVCVACFRIGFLILHLAQFSRRFLFVCFMFFSSMEYSESYERNLLVLLLNYTILISCTPLAFLVFNLVYV